MKTPAEFLDALKSRYELPSDYAVAKLLGVKPQMVSRWRHGHGGMSDENAARVAELLELDVGYVLAKLYEERATTEEARAVWRGLAARLAPVAALALLVVLLPYLQGVDGASWGLLGLPLLGRNVTLYIMSNLPTVLLGASLVLAAVALARQLPRPRYSRPA